MRVAFSLNSGLAPVRWLVCVLAVAMMVCQLPAQSSSDSKKPRPKPAASAKQHAEKSSKTSSKAAPKPAAKASTKTSAKAGTKSSAKASPAVRAKAASKPQSKSAAAEDAKASAEATSEAPAKKGKRAQKASRAVRAARTAKLKQAFVASTELRPMAQQLATLRSASAYAGVANYAHRHEGEAAAAAYLALGHAYLLDRKFSDAIANLRQAGKAGESLSDYADFLGARALQESGNNAGAEALLHGFIQRYPDSIFDAQVPELEANCLLAMGDQKGAQRVLLAAAGTPSADRTGYQLTLGEVDLALGKTAEGEGVLKRLLLAHPLSGDAQTARARLTAMGAESSLTATELRSLGDAYYAAGRYGDAGEQYRALARQASLDAQSRNGFAVAAASCDLKLKTLRPAEVQALPDTEDDNGARRLYLLMELARNRDDRDDQQRIVTEMKSRFPQSQWLAEALFSSGNMYLLRHEYATAGEYYGYLAAHFPDARSAPTAHWRAGWLCYRQGLYSDAARLFDEQIRLYPSAKETISAIYWRGRLYETQEHDPALAASNYRNLVRTYQHFFYAQLARRRLATLGDAIPVVQTGLDSMQAAPVPHLVDTFPPDSPHLAKAHLLANAGLNDYIAQEIAADPDSSSWSALAEAQIYSSYGETYRAMRSLKRALPYATQAPINSIPLAYWRILFPESWWDIIKTEAARNNLDPYLVASLIRQESEFNPSAVSRANAYGLMQLLPSVARSLAREEGISHLETFQLLDPATNIRLGTRYLRKTLDRFGGVTEYALAAYNAGDDRVVDWRGAGPYQGTDEFVESIPFTETRDYVQGILRNQEIYRAIDEYANSQNRAGLGASR